MLGDCRCPSEHSKVGQEQPHVVFTLLASKSSQALISQWRCGAIVNKQRLFRSFVDINLSGPTLLLLVRPETVTASCRRHFHPWASPNCTFYTLFGAQFWELYWQLNRKSFEYDQLLNLTRPLGTAVGGVSIRGRPPTALAAPGQSQSWIRVKSQSFRRMPISSCFRLSSSTFWNSLLCSQ